MTANTRPGEPWSATLTELGLTNAILVAESALDPARRVYLADDRIHKIGLKNVGVTDHLRLQDMAGEYTVLRRCRGVPGVPLVFDFCETTQAQVLVLEHIKGQPLDPAKIEPAAACRIAASLVPILIRLSLRGVSHGDLLPGNILIDDVGRPALVDFDQAIVHGRGAALRRNVVGRKRDAVPAHGSLLNIFEIVIRRYYAVSLPVRTLKQIRSKLKSLVVRDREVPAGDPLPDIPESAPPRLHDVRQAWSIAQHSDASSPGLIQAYYTLELDGYRFPGERPWAERWNTLRALDDFHGKRILELGCNMALLSSFLLANAGVAGACAVDTDPDILRSAELVAGALGVTPDLRCVDFDSTVGWEDDLAAFQPDVVFALNVLNWVHDKERLLAFLGRWNTVIFEGHDDFTTESERLRGVGFDQIRLVEVTERDRPLMVCSRH